MVSQQEAVTFRFDVSHEGWKESLLATEVCLQRHSASIYQLPPRHQDCRGWGEGGETGPPLSSSGPPARLLDSCSVLSSSPLLRITSHQSGEFWKSKRQLSLQAAKHSFNPLTN